MIGDVAAAAVADGVLRLLRHEPALLAGEADGVHRARVATRRLRSDLRTFRGVLDGDAVAPARAELRWLGGALGAARDADVLAARVGGAVAGLGGADAAAAGALLERLGAHRDAAHAHLRAVLASERYASAVALLLDTARHPPLTERAGEPVRKGVRRAVRRAWRPLAAAVEAAGPDPGDDALHRIRIDAKRARYAADAAAPVAGKRARRLARSLARLQGVLGELNDAVAAEAWLRGGPPRSAEEAFVAGRLAERQVHDQAAARAAWRPAWDGVVAARRRWPS